MLENRKFGKKWRWFVKNLKNGDFRSATVSDALIVPPLFSSVSRDPCKEVPHLIFQKIFAFMSVLFSFFGFALHFYSPPSVFSHSLTFTLNSFFFPLFPFKNSRSSFLFPLSPSPCHSPLDLLSVTLFSRVQRLYTSPCRSVGWLVGW